MVRRGWIVGVALVVGCQFESSAGSAGSGLGDSMGSTSETSTGTGSPSTAGSETSANPPTDPSTPTDPSADPTVDSTTESTTEPDPDSTDTSPATTAGDTESSSSSGEPLELQIAEELIVSLDATNGNASASGWINAGTMNDFVPVGSPTVGEVEGIVAVTLSDGNVFRSTQAPPSTLVEPDSTRTIEVWAYNPSAASDESMVAWGHRNGPPGSLMVFNYGTQPDWGAANHWGSPDLGWHATPQQAVWHHLVYTFDGTTTRVYVDGMLDNEEELGAGVIDTFDDDNILIGAQFRDNGELTNFASLSLARVRVHAGVLDDEQIAINYALESAELGL